MTTPPDTVRQRFAELRTLTDPRGHDLLDTLEDLCVDAVNQSRSIQAHIAVLEHERRVEETIRTLVCYPVDKPRSLRRVW